LSHSISRDLFVSYQDIGLYSDQQKTLVVLGVAVVTVMLQKVLLFHHKAAVIAVYRGTEKHENT